MLPDRISNPGSLTYESGTLPIALRGSAIVVQENMIAYCELPHLIWIIYTMFPKFNLFSFLGLEVLTLKGRITTAADIYKYFFIVFQGK